MSPTVHTRPDEIEAAPHVDGDASESYLGWRVGISKEVLGFGLDLSYSDAENEEVRLADLGRRLAGARRWGRYPGDFEDFAALRCRLTPDRRDPSAG
jgi:hypothetical protein